MWKGYRLTHPRANIEIESLTYTIARMNETTKENTDKILFQDSEVLNCLLQEYFSSGQFKTVNHT